MITNKTIFIAHNWSQTSVSRQSVELAKFFSKNNKVFFLNAKKRGIENEAINENLVVVEWPGKRPVTFKDLLFAFKMMKIHKPDIIISNFGANNIMLFVSWFLGVKIRIVYYHTMVSQHIADKGSLDIKQRINIWRKGILFKKATFILCPSSFAKKDLLQYYKVDEEKAIVFPNALPASDVINHSSTPAIGFIGRLHKSKGADLLVEAFIQLQREIPAAKLFIAGGGEEKKDLEKRVEEAGLIESVIFKGPVKNELIFDFIASLSFLVVPSRVDNLPTVVLEAFSTNTPVIGSNAGGIPEMIQDGYNGFLFEKENIDDLCSKMKALLTGKELRNRMAEQAGTTFKEKYSIENLQRRFEGLLEK